MKIFYFTATGNSLYVAKKIGGELYSIPQMIKEGKYEFEDEAIGFVFPCYAFGMPRLVKNFLKQSKFKASYFFAIMTFGKTPASGLQHIEQVGAEIGIKFNYTNEILMIDNCLPLFDMEDQLRNENSKKTEEKLGEIVKDITEKQNKLTRKSFISVWLSKDIRNLNNKFGYDHTDKRFIVQDNCSSCKVCEKVCPANNIKVGKKPEFVHRCEGCLACIHHCPQNAIDMKSQKSKARFINQNVKLKEIIASNDQTYHG